MTRKLGVQALRPATTPTQVQVTEDARAELAKVAADRCCSTPTMMRILLELLVANPDFLHRLLDDADLPSRDDDLPLLIENRDDDEASAPLRPLGAVVPTVSLAAVRI
jgi:hypothetical protein